MAVDGSGPVRDEHVVVGGRYEASPSTLADGERDDVRLTAAGQLRVSAEGAVAHDAADSGNPVKVGGRALATLPTALAASDRSDLLTDLYGRLHVTAGQRAESWAATHKPAVNTQATVSKAAGSAAQRHVCKGFSWTLSSGAGAPTPEEVTISIRDGATGAGTVIWQETVSLPATAGSSARNAVTGLYLVGTAATAMTIETDSAPGANVQAAVNIFGETIPA